MNDQAPQTEELPLSPPLQPPPPYLRPRLIVATETPHTETASPETSTAETPNTEAPATETPSTETETATADPDNFVLLFMSRVAVGEREALKRFGNSAPAPDWNQLDSAAKTAWDHIDEAIISAELYRPSDGADRLAAIIHVGGFTPDQRHLAQSLAAAYRHGKPPSSALSPRDVALLKTQGWFGQLALGQGLPDTDPARRAPLDSAARSFTLGAVAIVFGLAFLFIGGGFIIIAFVYLLTARVKWAFVPPPPDVVYLEAFVLYLATFLVAGLLLSLFLRSLDLPRSTAWILAVTPILAIAFYWPRTSNRTRALSGSAALTAGERSESKGVFNQGSFSRGDALPDEADFGSGQGVTTSSIEQIRQGGTTPPAAKSREYGLQPSVRQSLGWHRGRGIWIEIAFGFLGYIAYLPILLLSAYITVLLSHGKAMTHPVVPELMQAHGNHMLLIILAAVVAAPIMEETFFRGALFAHLRSRRRWIIAAPLVGLIFAVIHPQGWPAIPVIGGLGVFLCALREWRGSLIAPMTAHALNNLGALTLLLIAR